MEQGIESLRYRRSLSLILHVPYGTATKEYLFTDRATIDKYIDALLSRSQEPWKGIADKYPDPKVYKLEFRTEPRPAPPIMTLQIHPFGKILLNSGKGDEYAHQITEPAYDRILSLVGNLE